MIDLSINDGDLLIVDRSLEPKNNNVVVASVDGDFTVKIFQKRAKQIKLIPANKMFKTITVGEGSEFAVWGTVKHVIHTFQKWKKL